MLASVYKRAPCWLLQEHVSACACNNELFRDRKRIRVKPGTLNCHLYPYYNSCSVCLSICQFLTHLLPDAWTYCEVFRFLIGPLALFGENVVRARV